MFTVHEIARRYHVTRDTVLSWITSGVLKAIDVARHGGRRKMYRITAEAVLEFEAARAGVKETSCAASLGPIPNIL